MLATMSPKPRAPKSVKPEMIPAVEERKSFSTAPTLLDTFVAQLMESEDPRALLNTETKKGILKNNQKTADQILTTLRALDAIPSFAQRVAYINERSAKGAINNDVYRAFSLVVVKLDMRDTKNEREKRKAQEEKRELSLPDQAPLKWAYYWRRTNALADELEKPGGMVSYADVEDVRGRFRSEPKSLQDTIRDRICG